MKAVILLASLKKEGLSNTQVLCEFLSDRFVKSSVDCEIIKLVEHAVFAGTYASMGQGDEWPHILKKLRRLISSFSPRRSGGADIRRKCRE